MKKNLKIKIFIVSFITSIFSIILLSYNLYYNINNFIEVKNVTYTCIDKYILSTKYGEPRYYAIYKPLEGDYEFKRLNLNTTEYYNTYIGKRLCYAINDYTKYDIVCENNLKYQITLIIIFCVSVTICICILI